MKKYLFIVLMGIVLTGCSLMGGNEAEEKFKLTDLQGLWLEQNVSSDGHYVRFTTEQSEETGYLYGREWDEADDVFEKDLKPYGNGWFKYKFETTNGGLHELHLMDNGGAEIPKEYIVSKLTETELVYYEDGYTNIKYYFAKVVESNE